MLTFRFSQQRWLNAVKSPFTLQVLNTATVIPAHDHLLIPTTRVPPAIVTANPIKYRHIPSSHRERSDSERPFHRSRCGNWNDHIGGGHIWWVKTKRNWCRDLESRPEVSRWVSFNTAVVERLCNWRLRFFVFKLIFVGLEPELLFSLPAYLYIYFFINYI